jgi:hypothetical protein
MSATHKTIMIIATVVVTSVSISLSRGAEAAAQCSLYFNATTTSTWTPTGAGGCWVWDLTAVPAHTWSLNTSTCPNDCNDFLVSAPCGNADNTQCKKGPGSNNPAPAYQVGGTTFFFFT